MAGQLIVVRGAGDLATGVIQAFARAGLRVLALEAPCPTAIRRTAALSEAVYEGAARVEDIRCRLVETNAEMRRCHRRGEVPLWVDPEGDSIQRLAPAAVVDAIIAKRNCGTRIGMAPAVIALGPGFCAGLDAHAVLETMRGHDLGRLILEGEALPNTGAPGEIGGESARRVIHAPAAGLLRPVKNIGDIVHRGEALFAIDRQFVSAPISGRLRGLIRPGYRVHPGMKVADIDPRTDTDWRTISDKARCLGGAALGAFLLLSGRLRAAGEGAP